MFITVRFHALYYFILYNGILAFAYKLVMTKLPILFCIHNLIKAAVCMHGNMLTLCYNTKLLHP
jgi:hypothetical protein